MGNRSQAQSSQSTTKSELPPRCLIPDFDGAILSSGWQDALWVRFFKVAPPRQRRSRRAIQNSQESLGALAKRHGTNQQTVRKWRSPSSVTDLPTGPRDRKSTVLSLEEEAIIVTFRRQTLLPLDDYLYALQATIPHLTRSSLHHCLQRHGIRRLPDTDGEKTARKKFKSDSSRLLSYRQRGGLHRARQAVPLRRD